MGEIRPKLSEMYDHPSNAIRSVDRWLPSLPSSNLHGMASVQCVNNGLTSATLALRCQLEKILLPPLSDPSAILRERVNSQTDYPGVNSDVYENPIQIYANSLLSLSALALLSYYRNLQGATNVIVIATSEGLCLKMSVQLTCSPLLKLQHGANWSLER